MLISTRVVQVAAHIIERFQSLDWVDVDFDKQYKLVRSRHGLFQSLDWVDVDFDFG